MFIPLNMVLIGIDPYPYDQMNPITMTNNKSAKTTTYHALDFTTWAPGMPTKSNPTVHGHMT